MSLGFDLQETLEVLKQIEKEMLPIFVSVKLAQIRNNKKYILDCLDSGGPSNDLDEAEKTLLQFNNAKYLYPKTQQVEIVYPHNVYSIYCPVDYELQIQDQYVRTFPILRKLKEEFNVVEKGNFYSNMAETFRKNKADKDTWKSLLNKWIWDADLQRTVVYYWLLIRCGYNAVHLIKQKLSTNVQVSAISQHLEHMSKLLRNRSTLRKHIQFSVENREQINEVSIVKTTKQLLCGVCLVYDCPKHKLDDDIVQESNQFVHPRNKPSQKMKLETANSLLNHYYSNCTDSVMEEEKEDRGACSATCYRYLKRQTFQELRHQISGLLSPSIKALIKLGVQMFAYSPCHIALVAQSKITCSVIFWYFIKYQNVQSRIRFGFDTPINYLKSVTYAGKEELKQPRRKRKAKKKKESSTAQSKNGPLSSVTPICYHYFLHKQRSKEEDLNQTCDNCACALRKFCLPSCLCDNKCKLRIKGCSGCKDCYSRQCPCFNNDRECDPEVCKCCYPNPDSYDRNSLGQLITCTNNQYQLQRFPKIKLGLSSLTGGGLGLFAGQFIPKNSIIISYSGQLIQNPVQQLRECISSDMYFYNFGFHDSSIDAKYFGNKSRFINHDNNKIQNAYSKVKYAKSDSFLAVYALDDIKKDEELFFDYDGNGILFKDFRDKYPFITERRNPPKQFT